MVIIQDDRFSDTNSVTLCGLTWSHIDQPRFWLCVVPLDSDEDIDELSAERVENLARFVTGPGSRFVPARASIQDAVKNADESGFDLEHVDEIRYGIRAVLWNAAMPLKSFVEALSLDSKA